MLSPCTHTGLERNPTGWRLPQAYETAVLVRMDRLARLVRVGATGRRMQVLVGARVGSGLWRALTTDPHAQRASHFKHVEIACALADERVPMPSAPAREIMHLRWLGLEARELPTAIR